MLSLQALAENESIIRIAAFVGVFVPVAGWEAFSARRRRALARQARWSHNLGLLLVDVLVLRLVAPGAVERMAGAAGLTRHRRVGPAIGFFGRHERG